MLLYMFLTFKRTKMNRKTFFLSTLYLLFTLCAVTGPAHASAIKQMYELSLPVASQQKHIRTAAFEQGLIEVSMRVSGSSMAPTQLDLSRASQMISQYRYIGMSRAEIKAYMKQTASAVRPRYKLWMKFDDAKVKQQLRSKGLPIWGYQRPGVLIWLAVKDGKNRYLLKRSDQSQIKDAVEKEARRRGLPIIWPEYDAEDKQQLSFIDVWGEFWEPLKQVSRRYAADAILLGKMSWLNGSWQVNWSLQLEGKNESWQLSALDMGMITSSGIGVATDHISSRFAVYEGIENEGRLLLRVSDLSGVKAYAAASHYIASLAPVKSVYTKEINPSQADFFLELNGDENDLKRIIALGRVLVPDNRPEIEPEILQNNASLDNTPENNISGNNTPGVNSQQVNTQNAAEQNASVTESVPTNPPVTEPPKKRAHVLRYRMNG